MYKNLIKYFGIVMFMFLLSCSLNSDPSNVTEKLNEKGTAYTEIRSNKVVKFEVLLPWGEYAEMSLFDGQMGRIKVNDIVEYGFTPIVNDKNEISQIYTFKIEEKGENMESLSLYKKYNSDEPIIFDENHPRIEIQSTEVLVNLDNSLSKPVKQGGSCCVTCTSGNYTITMCGCAVETDCGSCCAGDCC